MPQASEVVPFPQDAMAPQCSQCRTKMVLETVEPHLVCSDRDAHTYRCKQCGLADRIKQKGCISEQLLRCQDAHELISYSEWATEADITLYEDSDAHKEIVRHTRGLKGSQAVVKLYDLVE